MTAVLRRRRGAADGGIENGSCVPWRPAYRVTLVAEACASRTSRSCRGGLGWLGTSCMNRHTVRQLRPADRLVLWCRRAVGRKPMSVCSGARRGSIDAAGCGRSDRAVDAAPCRCGCSHAACAALVRGSGVLFQRRLTLKRFVHPKRCSMRHDDRDAAAPTWFAMHARGRGTFFS